MAGQPKAPFYLAVFVVVAGLVAFAAWRGMSRPRGNAGNEPAASPPQITMPGSGTAGGPAGGSTTGVEAHDTASITTVKEYTFKPSERLPPVKGTARYKELENNTVQFALNVWAGWAPIIYANN